MSAYAVALHRVLAEYGMETQSAEALIADAVFASIRTSRDAVNMLARLRHRDRLRRLSWASGLARRFYYAEPDWRMTDVPVRGGVGMDVTRCVVAEFFDSLGMNRLCQRAICDQDARSAQRHGIVFVRSGTLVSGADRCDFRYLVASDGNGSGRPDALRDSIHIEASPEVVWAWLSGLDEHYLAWHPDHVSAAWVRGPAFEVGSVLRVVEHLGGHREQLDLVVTGVDPPRRLTYRIRGLHGLVLPGGAFDVSPDNAGSRFTATIECRARRVVERLAPGRTAALRGHMRQEGENLKRLLEGAVPPAE